ncbi:MAG: DUF1289 domain-containing protein, partial [Alphaproteobacteria bacterium]|nr:DUF1289 domain-containing protein [Alphaproteobacteria bacterium]
MIDSPCINICKIDPQHQVCTGCLRSLSEIASWSGMTPGARRAVMADLPSRRTAFQ